MRPFRRYKFFPSQIVLQLTNQNDITYTNVLAYLYQRNSLSIRISIKYKK